MSYENATSTLLLATHCAVCHRALRDAESVERGVGPDCAQNYGYDAAQTAPRWLLVDLALDGITVEAYKGVSSDPKTLANALVHRVALQFRDEAKTEENGRLIAAIRATGFTTLADKLAEGIKEWKRPEIQVALEGDKLVVTSSALSDVAFAALLAAVRAVPGRKWDAGRKASLLPVVEKRRFWGLLQSLPAGVLIKSTKGEYTTQGPKDPAVAAAEAQAERDAIASEPEAPKSEEQVAHRHGNSWAPGHGEKCGRCGGSGVLREFMHIESGRCFRCEGTGLPRPHRKAA